MKGRYYRLVLSFCAALLLLVWNSDVFAISLQDSFGREWNINVSGNKVTGFRDINNELGCGSLPVHGRVVSSSDIFLT